jgi:hypothetical protein
VEGQRGGLATENADPPGSDPRRHEIALVEEEDLVVLADELIGKKKKNSIGTSIGIGISTGASAKVQLLGPLPCACVWPSPSSAAPRAALGCPSDRARPALSPARRSSPRPEAEWETCGRGRTSQWNQNR